LPNEFSNYFHNLARTAYEQSPHEFNRQRKSILTQWKRYVKETEGDEEYAGKLGELPDNDEWEAMKNKLSKPKKN
jgi:hypothetical protein